MSVPISSRMLSKVFLRPRGTLLGMSSLSSTVTEPLPRRPLPQGNPRPAIVSVSLGFEPAGTLMVSGFPSIWGISMSVPRTKST